MSAFPSRALSEWFRRDHRRLPWRETYDPYRVWVSEVMLQQTQVETVLPYYDRFLDRFPTVEALAAASEDAVLAAWSGLGYYGRARNLRNAARRVVADHGAHVPDDHERLIALPGIGRYMAGAILSIAYNRPFPVVDGNVRRVLSRLHGWPEPKERTLWDTAAAVARAGEPRVMNQAMMELGATVCTPNAPRCGECPLRRRCEARKTGAQAEIPLPRKRPPTVRVDLHAVLDRNRNGYLMREDQGLWEFPMLTDPPGDGFLHLGHCRHAITHHRVEVDVYRGALGRRKGYRRVRFDAVPVTSLTRKIHALAETPPNQR